MGILEFIYNVCWTLYLLNAFNVLAIWFGDPDRWSEKTKFRSGSLIMIGAGAIVLHLTLLIWT